MGSGRVVGRAPRVEVFENLTRSVGVRVIDKDVVHCIGGKPFEPLVGADRAVALNPSRAKRPAEQFRFDVALDDRQTHDRHRCDYRASVKYTLVRRALCGALPHVSGSPMQNPSSILRTRVGVLGGSVQAEGLLGALEDREVSVALDLVRHDASDERNSVVADHLPVFSTEFVQSSTELFELTFACPKIF